MKIIDESYSFYNETINLIDLDDHLGAIGSIKKNIDSLTSKDDIALAYLNSGFLNDILGDYSSAIDDFSKAISLEEELQIIIERSRDISLNARSNSKYKTGNYKGAIDDKRKAKKIRFLEINKFSESNNKIDYKKILLGTFNETIIEPKYKVLIKVSKIKKSRYDLIADYKKVISEKRKEEIIKKLELISQSKYKIGDYKGSIKAIRRAEKYY